MRHFRVPFPHSFMLSRLDRTLLSRVFTTFGISLGVFTLMTLFSQMFRVMTSTDLPYIGAPALARLSLMFLMALSGATLPAALLTSLLVTIAEMSSDGELVALAAAGISPRRLLIPFLLAASLATGATAAATHFAEPWSRLQLRSLLVELEWQTRARSLEPGEFTRVGKGVAFSRIPQTATGVVLAFDAPGDARHIAVAQKGDISFDRLHQGLEVRLDEGVISRATPDGKYYRASFDTYKLSLPVTQLLQSRTPGELYPQELRQRIATLEREGRPTVKETVELEKKRAYPFGCLAFALLALPLGSYQSKNPRFYGFFVAMVLLLGYYLQIRLVDAYAALWPLSPALAVWAPNLVLGGLGLLLAGVKTSRI